MPFFNYKRKGIVDFVNRDEIGNDCKRDGKKF